MDVDDPVTNFSVRGLAFEATDGTSVPVMAEARGSRRSATLVCIHGYGLGGTLPIQLWALNLLRYLGDECAV
jgi:hypothetical protein